MLLNQETASLHLLISEDQKTAQNVPRQNLADNPKRFALYPCVLGHEGFTSGKHWWLVHVEKGQQWVLGVAKGSVDRKAFLTCPQCPFWAIERCDHSSTFQNNCLNFGPSIVLSIKVSLNYEGEEVLFFDFLSGRLITALPASFSGEKIYPFLCAGPETLLNLYPPAAPLLQN